MSKNNFKTSHNYIFSKLYHVKINISSIYSIYSFFSILSKYQLDQECPTRDPREYSNLPVAIL